MKQWIKRWLQPAVLALAALFLVVYVGDAAIFKLRHSPQGKVTVNHYVTIPLKGNKQEFDSIGSTEVPCAVALFPQIGESPCWLLRRYPH